MVINLLTLFPNLCQAFLSESIVGKAIKRGLITINIIDIREYSNDKHKRVDDTVYGGAPGMLIQVEPVVRALESCSGRRILLTPQGRVYNQEYAQYLATLPEITLVAGRYEGFDERVTHFVDDELSIGDYILNGGELAAMVIAESVIRLIPDVVGNTDSLASESFSHDGLLDYAQYTRPPVWRGLEVPEVLRSGDHRRIEEWRQQSRIAKTQKNRPDLWARWLQKRAEENDAR